jgi:sortase A
LFPRRVFPDRQQCRKTERLTRHRRARWLWSIALLVSGGMMFFGHGLYIFAKAELAQVLLHRAWARTQSSGEPTPPWPWADTHPVARLTAPTRGADVLVLSGASGRSLAFGPGHLPGSANPGEPGNSVIVAHRDTHFRFLQRVVIGDLLIARIADGTHRRFQVRRTYVVDFPCAGYPARHAVPTLTLVTCFPFDAINPGGPLRYVVVAEST